LKVLRDVPFEEYLMISMWFNETYSMLAREKVSITMFSDPPCCISINLLCEYRPF